MSDSNGLNYPSNANSKKKEKLEKITQGRVSTEKPGLGDQLATVFLGDHLNNIMSYIGKEVLLPAIRDAISDIGHGAIDSMFFREPGYTERRGRKDRGNSYIPYDKASYKASSDRDRRTSSEKRSSRDIYNIYLDSRGEAEEVIFRLVDHIEQYGDASVSDLYDLVGITGNFTDNKYGWTNLSTAKVVRRRGGTDYCLDLPTPELLD